MSSLFLVSVTAQTSPYDPWYDFDFDGDIDIFDVVDFAGRYGSTGTPINRTALLDELYGTIENLTTEVQGLEEQVATMEGLLFGPVSYWKFDEGNGVIASDSIGNNTGTLMNGSEWVDGLYGTAISFDGTDDYVSCGKLGTFGSATLRGNTTYMFRLKTNQTTQSRIMGTINDGFNTAFVIELNTPSTDKLRLYVRDDNGLRLSADLTDPFDFTGTGWHHIAFVVNMKNNNVTIYIDGFSRGVTYSWYQSPITFSDFQYPLAIGAWNLEGTVGSHFNGTLDEVLIWERALSAEEVLMYYANRPNAVSVTLRVADDLANPLIHAYAVIDSGSGPDGYTDSNGLIVWSWYFENNTQYFISVQKEGYWNHESYRWTENDGPTT